jgi:hypothetical protein
MTTLRLSSKLLKVTDQATAHLARHCPRLHHYKMTRCMTDASLAALAAGCKQLVVIDMRRCSGISEGGLLALLAGCGELRRLLLPPSLRLSCAVVQQPRCQLQQQLIEEELQQQTLVML